MLSIRLFFLAVVVAVLPECCNAGAAFHCGRGGVLPSSVRKRGADSSISSRTWGVTTTTTNHPPRYQKQSATTPEPHATTTTTTVLNAALKFKNMEEMLDSFQAEPVLLAFTAVNCGPCKLQKQELAAFRDMMMLGSSNSNSNNNVRMLAIDTDKWPNVGSQFSVAKLPCIIFMKDKQIVARMEGLITAEVLAQEVRSHLQSSSTTTKTTTSSS